MARTCRTVGCDVDLDELGLIPRAIYCSKRHAVAYQKGRDAESSRACRTCLSIISPRGAGNSGRPRTYCALCYKNGRRMRDMDYRKAGTTLPEVEQKLAVQGGRCAACGSDDPAHPFGWVLDHDHACCLGRRRCGKCNGDILCHSCNVILGYLRNLDHAHAVGLYRNRQIADRRALRIS